MMKALKENDGQVLEHLQEAGVTLNKKVHDSGSGGMLLTNEA